MQYRQGSHQPAESKFGYVIYDGNPEEYHHWIFRTNLKFATTKVEDLPSVMAHVVENLRGRAMQVAVSIGIQKVTVVDVSGKKLLLDAMQQEVFPLARQEAKEWYREGHRLQDGISCRQSYIRGRTQWWDLLKSLHETISLS